MFKLSENRKITSFGVGFNFVFAVENKRNLYSWGCNSNGQLGLGFVNTMVEHPTQVQMEVTVIKEVACGENHSILLTDRGTMYSCGSQVDGRLGVKCGVPTDQPLFKPIPIPNFSSQNDYKVLKIACNASHSMALVSEQIEDAISIN